MIVPYYPKTFTGTICVPIVCQLLPIVVLGNENSRDCPLGHFPRNFVPGRRNLLQQQFFPRTIVPGDKFYSKTIHSNVQIVFRLFTILPLPGMCPKKTDLTLENFNISPLNHNDFTISPYVRKILIHHYTIWKTKKTIAPFRPKTILIHSNHPTISTLHHIMISPFHRGATTVNPHGIIKREVIK